MKWYLYIRIIPIVIRATGLITNSLKLLLKRIGVENVKISFSNVKRMYYLEHSKFLSFMKMWLSFQYSIVQFGGVFRAQSNINGRSFFFLENKAVNKLLAVKDFRTKAWSWMLDWVLKMPLKLSKFLGFLRITKSTVGWCYLWYCQKMLNGESLLSIEILMWHSNPQLRQNTIDLFHTFLWTSLPIKILETNQIVTNQL